MSASVTHPARTRTGSGSASSRTNATPAPVAGSDEISSQAAPRSLAPKRPRRLVENDEYAAFVRRILRAYARQVGDGDVEALAIMVGLAEEIDTAIAQVVKGLRGFGYFWADRCPARHHPPGRSATLESIIPTGHQL
jgi:hypothetical protein